MLPRPRPPAAELDDAELLPDADVEVCAEPAPPPIPWAKGTQPAARRPEALVAPVTTAATSSPPLSVAEVYDRHAPFVFRVLRGLGVGDDRVDDAVQDVFIVVHRRLAEFEARSSLTTWLYAIARRVASQYRRSAAARRTADADLDAVPAAETPYDDARRNQAARLLASILEELDPDKREVFVLIEIEQMSAPDVAGVLGIPVNTVYSRLRLARQRFEAAMARRMPGGMP
jgi:RNA polymerase sigma-70 factor (ECF subfamily)